MRSLINYDFAGIEYVQRFAGLSFLDKLLGLYALLWERFHYDLPLNLSIWREHLEDEFDPVHYGQMYLGEDEEDTLFHWISYNQRFHGEDIYPRIGRLTEFTEAQIPNTPFYRFLGRINKWYINTFPSTPEGNEDEFELIEF